MDVDILIIGAGPAGASAAILLARAGYSVAIVDKKAFPRPKVCGEFISATTLPLLHQLGVADYYLDHAGPVVRRVGWFSGEKMLTAMMPAVKHSQGEWGRALGRDQLDQLLIDEAGRAGANVFQPWEVYDFADKKNHFQCSVASKERREMITARMVVMAHGSWEQGVIATPEIPHKNSDLLAFKAHFKHSSLDRDLMPLFSFAGGYGGLVHTDSDKITLSCCIRRDMLHKIRSQTSGKQAADVVFGYILSQCVGVRRVLSTAERVGPWLSVGPLRPGIRKQYANGIFYIGNIAGEAHPLIAEGISMAMQSAGLLAQTLSALPTFQRQDLHKAGREYTKKWKKQFAKRIHVAALFTELATRPRMVSIFQPLLEQFPFLLSFSARLSGKVAKFPIEMESAK